MGAMINAVWESANGRYIPRRGNYQPRPVEVVRTGGNLTFGTPPGPWFRWDPRAPCGGDPRCGAVGGFWDFLFAPQHLDAPPGYLVGVPLGIATGAAIGAMLAFAGKQDYAKTMLVGSAIGGVGAGLLILGREATPGTEYAT